MLCFCRTLALELGIQLYIVRVPTKDNLADDPSRERYGLLEQLGVRMFAPVGDNVFVACVRLLCLPQAEFREPCLDPRFRDATSWDSLGVTTHRAWQSHKDRMNSEGGAATHSLACLGKAFSCALLWPGVVWSRASRSLALPVPHAPVVTASAVEQELG